ncbi:LytR C-terminal domain-containing protein [Ornithinimicrobium pratense]|uniref:LytR family transcriptional regulator n=1 Tax=Ornithinimicrobium pratense TaxID=2593973 RepID=A0A5J6V7B0_9MICO|nr:LytR C-terminal domain-containing protein [Ornithinimicrobium pratense]QFG69638.1 LytR family transcriptional regulator [Ornithinimicrobium pratense]
MGYVRTAGMSTAARRARRRAGLVIAGLLAALLLALVVALAIVQGWFSLGEGGADDASQTTAAEVPAPSMLPSEVSVNVFNATSRGGLAGRTADSLRERGFDVQGVDNTNAVEGPGLIRYGSEAQEQAELLAESVGQGVVLELVEREGTTVDLVLGPDWTDLTSDAEATTDG